MSQSESSQKAEFRRPGDLMNRKIKQKTKIFEAQPHEGNTLTHPEANSMKFVNIRKWSLILCENQVRNHIEIKITTVIYFILYSYPQNSWFTIRDDYIQSE